MRILPGAPFPLGATSDHTELFERGAYVALEAPDAAFAFARRHGGDAIRLLTRLPVQATRRGPWATSLLVRD